MRGMTAILLCGSLFGAAAFGGDPTFPYTARVAVDEVEVRCGPGWDYYATQRLKRGEMVEVYRHDPGGWLAIRPPDGSFSWVTARQVKPTADAGIAEVVLDGTVAWVGSSVAEVPQHKWQVRLARDERVEVLGELAMTVGPGFATETYTKIAPPAGEFRWIHAQHALSSRTAAQETVVRSQASADYRHIGGPTATTPAESSPTTTKSLSVTELARQIEELKISLSLLVTQEIEQWDLGALRQRADTLAQQALDPALTRDVKAVLARMQEYEALQRRYRKVQERDIDSHRIGRLSLIDPGPDHADREGTRDDDVETDDDAAVEQQDGAAAPRLLPDDWVRDLDAAIGTGVSSMPVESRSTRYAVQGWLMPVHSTKRVAPPFAVLDDENRVRAYVTPMPGLNLRRYTRQYVGLLGTQHYVEALRAPHITAERVVRQKRD